MIGEREDMLTEMNYGDLTMRSYTIDGNDINAFYDSDDDLVFVLDNTITEKKPNVLLVINPDGDKKWDEILSNQYRVDLETIRPKVDNKYQKLDIEYSGLNIYDNLIKAFIAGTDIAEDINQLNILRDSAAKHSAMMRLNVANEIISKTNITIVKTKESIVRLQSRVKTLRAKLSQQKKEIGKQPTKQSASKILKIESQIEATNEKIKRAKKRLESAQKRLEIATIDAELASDLLNMPETEIVKNVSKSSAVSIAPKYDVQTTSVPEEEDEDLEEDIDEEVEDNSSVKPLFDKDPEILNEDIAFKPITFDAPVMVEEEKTPALPPMEEETKEDTKEDIIVKPLPELEVPSFESVDFDAPLFNNEEPIIKAQEEPKLEIQPVENIPEIPEIKDTEQKPVLETFTPMPLMEEEPVIQNTDYEMEQKQTEELTRPVSPIPNIEQKPQTLPGYNQVVSNEKSKPTFIYYVLLFALIILSVFTLWLYQKNMGTSTPMLVAKTTESTVEEKAPVVKPVVQEPVVEDVVVDNDEVFLDVVEEEPVTPVEEISVNQEPVEEQAEVEEETDEEIIEEPTEPVVLDAVPANVMTSGLVVEEEVDEEPIAEPEVNKPVFEVSSKRDDIFVSEQDIVDEPNEEPTEDVNEDVFMDDNADNPFYDEEEAAYQAELEFEE